MEIKETDLRAITRDSDTCLTRVKIRTGAWWDRGKDLTWLVFGQAQIRKFEQHGEMPHWWLTSYLKDGATDFEHDSAHALRLPLVSLTFCDVHYHDCSFLALVHPEMEDEFHVPLPGYNPFENPKTCQCDTCKDDNAHMIVPEGLYVPPFEPELYEAVRGRPVKITIGPPHP